MMVEAGAQEVAEEQMVGALDAGHAAIKQIVATIDDLVAAGKKKLVMPAKESDHAFYREVEDKAYCRSPTRCASRTSSRTTAASTRCSPNWSRRFRKPRSSGASRPRKSSRA